MKNLKQVVVAIIFATLFYNVAYAKGFMLKSDDFAGQLSINQVFNGFGCKGKNISPQLSWTKAPKGVKSFAITMYDKDAPTGSGWWHWVVFDIPKNISSIDSKHIPKQAIESLTDFGTTGFGGACPPKGDTAHQYIITIYALDVAKLGVDKNASPALVGFMLYSHTIAKSSIVAYYKR